MATSKNNGFDSSKQVPDQIMNEIMDMLSNPQVAEQRTDRAKLSDKLKDLVALAAALALQRDEQFIEQVVKKCLQAGANPNEIRGVLQVAILMAEIPAEKYSDIIHRSIDNWKRVSDPKNQQ